MSRSDAGCMVCRTQALSRSSYSNNDCKSTATKQSKVTPGFLKHKWRPIAFSLVVDNFGVKYVGKEHADHLTAALKQDYELDEDWEGTKYCGVSLDWNYIDREVHLSMHGYVEKARQRFNHIPMKKNENISACHSKLRCKGTIC